MMYHAQLWKVLRMRNKGMSLQRIADRINSTPEHVREMIRQGLETFDADHLSELIANNRVNMPEGYE